MCSCESEIVLIKDLFVQYAICYAWLWCFRLWLYSNAILWITLKDKSRAIETICNLSLNSYVFDIFWSNFLKKVPLLNQQCCNTFFQSFSNCLSSKKLKRRNCYFYYILTGSKWLISGSVLYIWMFDIVKKICGPETWLTN